MEPTESPDRAQLKALLDRAHLKAALDEHHAARTEAEIQADAATPEHHELSESALRGAANGITYNLADEAYGVVGGFANPADIPHEPGVMGYLKGFPERYGASRDYAHEKDTEAKKENPWAYGTGNLVGTVASPVSRALAYAGGAGGAAPLLAGAAGGRLAAAGASTAHPFQGGEESKKFEEDMDKGTVVGAGLGLGGQAVGGLVSKLAPDSLRRFASSRLAKAAGGTEEDTALLSQADDAGAPVVGPFSKAEDIGKAARGKQAYFEEQVPQETGPSWHPFGGPREKEIGGSFIDPNKLSDSQSRAASYGSIADSAEARAAEEAATKTSWTPSLSTAAMTLMHSHDPVKAAMIGAATKVGGAGASAIGQRSDAMMGTGANAMASAFESAGLDSIPQNAQSAIGTTGGAAEQYLTSRMGAAAAVSASPEQASAERRRLLRQAMVKRMGDLQEQGYNMPPLP